jgi:fibronectin-binding autotransporter adhesin
LWRWRSLRPSRPPAHATNYTWDGSTSYSGSADPSSLGGSDQLTITNTLGTPVFDTSAGDLTNAGTVVMSGGAGGITILINDSAAVSNSGIWNTTGSGNSQITENSGTGNTFTNTGTFENTGSGTLTVATTGNLLFTDTGGIINASGGPINFTGSNVAFNGTSFEGAAGVGIYGAGMTGNISSANNALNLAGGTITATSPVTLTTASGSQVTWSAATLVGSWTVPSGSTLTAVTNGTQHQFSGATVNNAGIFNYGASDTLLLNNTTTLTNNGTFNVTTPTTITENSGTTNSFVNNGAFNNTSGGLVTVRTTGNLLFTNSGTGTLTTSGTSSTLLTGGNFVFNDGTTFNGGGAVTIDSGAAFNGGFTVTADGSTLNLTGGTFTGAGGGTNPLGATLYGAMSWTNGILTGSWVVANGSTLNAITNNSQHQLSGATVTVNNGGTFNYGATDTLLINNSTALTNNGTFNITAPTTITENSGTTNSFVNSGLMQQTSAVGTGTTTIATTGNLTFANNGILQVLSGTLVLPSSFTNAGTLAGTATFSAPGGLTNNGHIAPGTFLAPDGKLASPGTLTLTGNLTQNPGSFLDIGMVSGTNFGSLVVNGNATVNLGSTLDVMCLSSCNIPGGPGVQYLVMSVTGSGNTLSPSAASLFTLVETGFAPGTPAGDFSLNQSGNNLYLDVSATVGGRGAGAAAGLGVDAPGRLGRHAAAGSSAQRSARGGWCVRCRLVLGSRVSPRYPCSLCGRIVSIISPLQREANSA